MNSLAAELKQIIAARLERAGAAEILSITSQLASIEPAAPAEPAPLLFGGRAGEGRFARVSDDLVGDCSTGLTWARASLSGGKMTWERAKAACAALELGGFKDWRLPTVRELLTLIDYDLHNPCIDTAAFQCEPDWYWTATPAAVSPADDAWIVSFYDGNSGWDRRGAECFVRAVRSSQ